jgi:ribulose-phosphate 3-epimerase
MTQDKSQLKVPTTHSYTTMTLYPAILTDSPELLAQQLELAQQFLEVDTVQIDIIDGFFADNLTITPTELTEYEFGELQLDLHFMTEEPLDFLYETRDVKDLLPIRMLIAQVERLSSQADFLREARVENWKAGLSLDLFTPLDAVDPESWEALDCIQIMGISAGFQQQKFHPQALVTLEAVAKKVASLDRSIEIIVDGGVTLDQVIKLAQLGATGIAVGSSLWNASDPILQAEELSSIV